MRRYDYDDYERGYRDGRREALREAKTVSFSEDDLEELIKKYNLKIIDRQGIFYTLSDNSRNIGTGFGFSEGKVTRIWIKFNMENTGFSDVEYYGKIFDSIRNFYMELKNNSI